jgi:dienelactone hydrolase
MAQPGANQRDEVQGGEKKPPHAAAPGSRLHKRTIAARVLLALLFALGVYLTLVPQGRAVTRAALLLPALITLKEPALLVAVGGEVRHTQAQIRGAAGPIYLDIYEPVGAPPPIPGAREGVVIIPGVGDNRQVDQVVNLSMSLARAGLVAVNITTDSLIDYDLTPADADAVVRSVLYTQQLPGVGADRVGILGFSAGGDLAALAAADPRIRDSLAFITLFGGYYDATTLLADYGRRGYVLNGQVVPWTPNIVPLVVFANAIADTLPHSDAEALRAAFTLDGFTPLSDAQLAALSPAAAAAYHLLAGDQPEMVTENVSTLVSSPQVRPLLAALSPAGMLPGIAAPIYLLHDRNDQFIPFTQSQAFNAALDRLHHEHTYAEFGIFAHVEVKSGVGGIQLLQDGFTLFRLLVSMLAPST